MRGTKVKALRQAMVTAQGQPWKRYFRLANGMIVNDGVQGKLRKLKKVYKKLNLRQRSLV